MTNLKLISVSPVKTEKERSDERPSRMYYKAGFQDTTNPFSPERTKVIWQQHVTNNETGVESCVWKGGDPERIKAFIGKEMPGAIVNVPVEEYDIPRGDGTFTQATSLTVVVLGHETVEQVVKASGRIMRTLVTSAAHVNEPAIA